MILIFSILFVWNIGNAVHDAWRKVYDHPANAILYCVLILFLSFKFDGWKLIPAMLCFRPLIFDHALNLLRGLPLTYQSVTTSSVVDKTENALFGRKAWLLSNLVYLAVVIINLLIVEK